MNFSFFFPRFINFSRLLRAFIRYGEVALVLALHGYEENEKKKKINETTLVLA